MTIFPVTCYFSPITYNKKKTYQISGGDDFQADIIDRFTEWCTCNKFDLNIQKCRGTSYTIKTNPVEFNYLKKDSIILQYCLQIKKLKIIFDENLNLKSTLLTLSRWPRKWLDSLSSTTLKLSSSSY